MAKNNLTKVANIDATARELDFVSRFAQSWQALRDILGITRAIRKQPGTQLVSYTASVTLESGSVGEGEEIPYSQAEVVEAAKSDVTIEKYAKAVSIEAVSKYGAEVAVEKTDDAFLNQLIQKVMGKFYTFLNTGALTGNEDTWQMALAMAKGMVLDKFNKINKTVTEVVGFANVLDAYQYIGAANISIQTAHGISYIKDFMGYSTLFLLSEPNIARGTVIATPIENLDLYYVDPADSDFAKMGLQYTTDGETNLIGFHVQGNYGTAVGESFALMGMALWAEYLDGIAVVTVGGPKPGITLNKSTASVAASETVTLEATTVPDDAEVTWASSDSTVATVANGVVTGVAAGEATITAKITVDGTDYTATCAVTVSGV